MWRCFSRHADTPPLTASDLNCSACFKRTSKLWKMSQPLRFSVFYFCHASQFPFLLALCPLTLCLRDDRLSPIQLQRRWSSLNNADPFCVGTDYPKLFCLTMSVLTYMSSFFLHISSAFLVLLSLFLPTFVWKVTWKSYFMNIMNVSFGMFTVLCHFLQSLLFKVFKALFGLTHTIW